MKDSLRKIAAVGATIVLSSGVAFAGSAGNENTGYMSDNWSEVKSKNELRLENENKADISNHLKVRANSGGNEADYNTGSGEVDTGDADTSITITNRANRNETDIDSGSLMMNELSATNNTTGAHSMNTAKVRLENKMKIENENKANVRNCVDVKASTGYNSSSYNTGNGTVSTGNASSEVTIENELNSNSTSIN